MCLSFSWFKSLFFLATIFSALSLIATASPKAETTATFPGKISEIKSPNGFYTIKNFDPAPTGEIIHRLYLLRRDQRKPILLRSYDRDVDILWSPDSSAFVVNDWIGSNITNPYLYYVNNTSHPIEITSKLFAALKGGPDRYSLNNSDHLYVFATRWRTPTSLEIKVTGHGPQGAFTIFYVWNLKRSFQRVGRMSKEVGGKSGLP